MQPLVKKNNSIPRSESILICIFIINYLRFYNFGVYNVFTPVKYTGYIIDISYATYFFFCFLRVYQTKSWFEKSVNILYLVFLGSSVVGFIGGQSIVYWLRGAAPGYLTLGFYYYLRYKKIPISYVMRILKYMLIGYVIIMILCYLQYPDSWWGVATWEDDGVGHLKSDAQDRGTIRFALPCKMLIPLFIFYLVGLEKSNSNKDRLIKLTVLFILLLMIGNRYPLFLTVLLVIFTLILSSRYNLATKIKMTFSILVIFILVLVMPFTNKIVSSLVEHSNTEYEGSGENNIRILAATYYFTEFNDESDKFHIYLGNGIEVPKSNDFAKRMDELRETRSFYSSDVGYCQIYLFFGVVGLIALFLWYISALKLKTPSEASFIKLYFTFLILSMIAGGYWFENMVIVALLSYILSQYNRQYKQLCNAKKRT